MTVLVTGGAGFIGSRCIEILEQTLGKKAVVNFMPMQMGDVPATWADTSKAQRLLAYAASVPVEEGVPCFVSWYREFYRV